MSIRDPESIRNPSQPDGLSPPLSRTIIGASPAFILLSAFASFPPALDQHPPMYRLVAGRRVQNGFIRPRIPFPTNLTRRAAHSGLQSLSICGDYQRGLITFKSRPLPSKNPQLWSLVRTRRRYQRRPFRLAPTRKVLSIPLSSPFLTSSS